MLTSLEIENYRGFKSFRMEDLGRINLLVGKNSVGKTSILEALQLLHSGGNFKHLGSSMVKRGELVLDEGKGEARLNHLVYGRKLRIGTKNIRISSISSDSTCKVFELEILRLDDKQTHQNMLSLTQREKATRIGGAFIWYFDAPDPKKFGIPFELSGNQSSILYVRTGSSPMSELEGVETTDKDLPAFEESIVFIGSEGIDNDKRSKYFSEFVLTENEKFTVEALKIIDSSIQRIAFVQQGEGLFYASLKGTEGRVPLGSLGEGALRIFGMALALITARDGYLLIDDIDSGLHYSVMIDMWTLISKLAKRLNIQVFATTHSGDCWRSMAEVIRNSDEDDPSFRIHRIEKDRTQTITFNDAEIAIAEEDLMEVR